MARLKGVGTVYGWGANGCGAVGDGTDQSRGVPVPVVGLPADIAQVAAGNHFGLALDRSGTAWSWGTNEWGQLGDGTLTSRLSTDKVHELTGVAGLDAGFDHSLAVLADGSVWGWGLNFWGQLGDPGAAFRAVPVPLPAPGMFGQVAAGQDFSLALRCDGSVWSWGANGWGQLGDGSTADRPTPARVAGLRDVTRISAGRLHALALDREGRIWAWGENGSGQLGLPGGQRGRPGGAAQPVPSRLALPARFVEVSAGHTHSLAIDTHGTVWSWGDDGAGQLGDDGPAAFRPAAFRPAAFRPAAGAKAGPGAGAAPGAAGRAGAPARIGLTRATRVVAGWEHSLAVLDDGSLWTWGLNAHGLLGTGTAEPFATRPVRVPGPLEVPGGQGVHWVAAASGAGGTALVH